MNTDVEGRLSSGLANAAELLPVTVPDPVAFRARVEAKNSRWAPQRSRRVVRRWAMPVVSAALVVGGWLCISSLGMHISGSHDSNGRGSALATVAPTAGTSLSSGQPSALPKDMSVTDFTFVSDVHGWVIGQGHCASALCTKIEHTVDGGRSWQPTPAPNLQAGQCCPAPAIRFADDRNGYVFTDQSFYATTDGGASWQQQSGGAVSLEVRNGVALRVSENQPCNWPCGRTLSSARVGATEWIPVSLPGAVSGDEWWGTLLVRTTHRVVLAYLRNEFSGGNQQVQATLYLSSADGRQWVTRPDPCGPVNGVEADTSALASASDGTISVLCMPRTDDNAYILQSFDGGHHFGATRVAAPAGKGVDALATPDRRTFLVAVTAHHQDTVYRSDRSGRWAVVAVAPNSGTVSGKNVLGFEDAKAGRWIPQQQNGVYSTADGGQTWTRSASG